MIMFIILIFPILAMTQDSLPIFFFLYLYIYPPDSQESEGGANT